MGYSGTLAMADRPDARRLLQDARDPPFDLPVVYRIDRLGARSAPCWTLTLS